MSRQLTPETDAERREGLIRGNAVPTHVVPVEFAEELERERDEAREQEKIHFDNYTEARAVADGLASVAAHCLGRHDHECPDAAIKIAAALKRWKKSQ
jgi:hypothetical protein